MLKMILKTNEDEDEDLKEVKKTKFFVHKIC